MKSIGVSLVFCLVATVAACGPAGERPIDASGGGGGGGGGGDGGGGGGGDGGGGDNCSSSAKLVYVIDQSNAFSQFDPSTKTFQDLGTLNCGGGDPYSMSVDRNTIAWVVYSTGQLFRVDINNNLACTATSWDDPALLQFGMGFSSDASGGSADTLFIAGGPMATLSPTSTLETLDTTTLTATSIGTVSGWPELTGTDTAELWGWFPDTTAPRVEQIDKTTGSALTTWPLPTLAGQTTAWAFAFWGGDFWIFLEKDAETSTTVYQIDGTSGAIKGMTPTNTRTIVGAGVSTCAPVVIERQSPSS